MRAVAASLEGFEKTVGGQQSLDGEGAFEMAEVQMLRDHEFSGSAPGAASQPLGVRKIRP